MIDKLPFDIVELLCKKYLNLSSLVYLYYTSRRFNAIIDSFSDIWMKACSKHLEPFHLRRVVIKNNEIKEDKLDQSSLNWRLIAAKLSNPWICFQIEISTSVEKVYPPCFSIAAAFDNTFSQSLSISRDSFVGNFMCVPGVIYQTIEMQGPRSQMFLQNAMVTCVFRYGNLLFLGTAIGTVEVYWINGVLADDFFCHVSTKKPIYKFNTNTVEAITIVDVCDYENMFSVAFCNACTVFRYNFQIYESHVTQVGMRKFKHSLVFL